MATKGEQGFTLIEGICAIFILTISLLSLAQLMMVGLERYEFARYDTKAVNLAQAKVEELRTQFSWQIESGGTAADLAPGSHGPESVVLNEAEGSLQGSRSFSLSWNVTNLAGGQKAVTVTVRPQNQEAPVSKSLSVTSHFAP